MSTSVVLDAQQALAKGELELAFSLYSQAAKIYGDKLFAFNLYELGKQLAFTKVVSANFLQPLGAALPKSYPEGKRQAVKIACIMDEFTYLSYSPEAVFFQLTPDNCLTELAQFQPDMLFIESAWRGKNDSWGAKVGHKSSELQNIVAWCNDNKVATLFWNKEDPVHFETFLNTAKLFDHVFTTDLDCIHRYKAALKHDRVYFLPFACQPQMHNPVELYQRKDAFCFAGAYYVKYPSRTADLENYVSELPKFKPLEIFDRNFGKDDANYQFPEHYQPYIVGTLPYSEIDKAYKGYKYSINLNSIKQSQTMFARRVFELLACNTLTISNFSRGVRLMFGDLVPTSDNGAEIIQRLTALQQQPFGEEKLRLAALRKVMQQHTYQHRLSYVLDKVLKIAPADPYPKVTVISYITAAKQVLSLLQNINRQQYAVSQTLLVLGANVSEQEVKLLLGKTTFTVKYFSVNHTANQAVLDCVANSWVAPFHPEDYYGANYLTDLVLATAYSSATLIGKGGYFSAEQGEARLTNQQLCYKTGAAIVARRSIFKPSAVATPIADMLTNLDDFVLFSPETLSVDAFNYCENVGDDTKTLVNISKVTDDIDVNVGVSISLLQNIAENMPAMAQDETQLNGFSAENVFNLIGHAGSKMVQLALESDGLLVCSQLADGKHEYVYNKHDISREQLMAGQPDQSVLPMYLDAEPGLNLSLVLIFFNKDERLSHIVVYPNRNNTITIPDSCTKIRIGLRVLATGQAHIKRLVLAKLDTSPAVLINNSDVLLVTNHYPSYYDIYRNGFVHSRIKAYCEHNVNVDVFRLRPEVATSWHEYQNIDVTTGSQLALRRQLEAGQYRHILVHFLDPLIWEVLKDFIDTIKVTVWVHGADIQPWHRRAFNYDTEEQIEKAKVTSEQRSQFWHSVLREMHPNLKLIFVSNYFAEEVMEDLGYRLPETQYQVIHNPIDTDLFSYQPKNPEQRKKILSIRPYSSKVYANDLAVKAVLELSKEPFFNELEFRFVGDGVLFDELTEPLKQFSNVILQKGFLSQQEISILHKEYGIFLSPSRMDTQGVSRDESMSSGLVPITSNVGAIPEFVSSKSGFLCEPESYIQLKESIIALYNDSDLFLDMSKESSLSVAGKSGKYIVVEKEISLF